MKYKLTLGAVLSFLIVLSGCLSSERLPQLPEGALPWSPSRQITWSDFWGTPIKTSGGMACQIFVEAPAYFDRPSLFSKVSVVSSCYMDRKDSWVDSTKATPQLLLYAQTVFNIYELYTRKFRQQIDSTTFGVTDVNTQFNKAFQKNQDELMNTLKQFEADTRLGSDLPETQRWFSNVNLQISQLARYATD